MFFMHFKLYKWHQIAQNITTALQKRCKKPCHYFHPSSSPNLIKGSYSLSCHMPLVAGKWQPNGKIIFCSATLGRFCIRFISFVSRSFDSKCAFQGFNSYNPFYLANVCQNLNKIKNTIIEVQSVPVSKLEVLLTPNFNQNVTNLMYYRKSR